MQLEWLTSVPWPNSVPSPTDDAGLPHLKDRSFLTAARTQLDADHFGLEKIKKRLIEYLAVVRLKELNAERETLEEQKRVEAMAVTSAAGTEIKANPTGETQKNAEQSTALVPFDKQSTPPPPSKSVQVRRPLPRTNKKNIKGPILL